MRDKDSLSKCDCCMRYPVSQVMILEPVPDLGFDKAQPFGLCFYCYVDYQITYISLIEEELRHGL